MIYLEDGSVVPVDKSELPITLPYDADLKSSGNPLDNHPNWKNTIHKKLANLQLERQIHLILLLTLLGIFKILFPKK